MDFRHFASKSERPYETYLMFFWVASFLIFFPLAGPILVPFWVQVLPFFLKALCLQSGVLASAKPHLEPPQDQKVSSRIGETQVFALAAFSTAHSSWLLLSSSWGYSWPAFGPQNGPQIGPEVAQEVSQKRGPKTTKKNTQNVSPRLK